MTTPKIVDRAEQGDVEAQYKLGTRYKEKKKYNELRHRSRLHGSGEMVYKGR